jgi:hypothetical protein
MVYNDLVHEAKQRIDHFYHTQTLSQLHAQSDIAASSSA